MGSIAKLTVVDDFRVSKYHILTLSGSLQDTKRHHKYRIDGQEYEPVIVYDAGDNVIGIEADGGFKGKEVEFV